MALVGKAAQQIAEAVGLVSLSEHDEQVEVVRWARTHSDYLPELRLLFAIPNGGHRHPATAARLQTEGVAPGVPDLCLPVARGGHHGWYGELKRRKGGRVAPAQAEWHAALTAQGYRVDVCAGAEAMIGALCAYLEVG